MSDSDLPQQRELLRYSAQIVSALVAHNQVAPRMLPHLIRQVYAVLARQGEEQPEPSSRPAPAVPVKHSVFADHIICLEDGRKLKALKRYLQTKFKMTPREYRQRWDLPDDYPMVALTYSAQRSALAKARGFGRRRTPEMSTPAPKQSVR